jgi:hypothetical protein
MGPISTLQGSATPREPSDVGSNGHIAMDSNTPSSHGGQIALATRAGQLVRLILSTTADGAVIAAIAALKRQERWLDDIEAKLWGER